MKCVVVFMAEAPVPNDAPPVPSVVVADSADSDVTLPELLVVRNRQSGVIAIPLRFRSVLQFPIPERQVF